MNEYEARQEAKRERLRDKAGKINAESDRLYKAGTEALKAIPFGQPILVGHHSERSDRAYRGRAVAKIDKSFRLINEAKEVERRADSVGTGGISSDDPDAVSKLEAQLLERQEAQATMTERNKEDRANGVPKSYPTWALSNNNAQITRIKTRIESLQSRHLINVRSAHGPGWTMSEDLAENRVLFTFPGKPTEEIRALLKRQGFVWSHTRTAWVRKFTNAARFAASQVIAQLPEMTG